MISTKAAPLLLALSLSLPAEIPGDPWEITGAAGLSYSDGNSDSLAYNLQFLATRVTDENELFLSADYFFSESNGLETTDSLRLSSQYNHVVQERLYFGATADFLTDDVADIDYRLDVSPLLGWYALKDETHSLAFELGPGYTWENQGGIDDSYLNLRFSERYERKLGDYSKLWQSLTFTPEASDFTNHLITAELGVDTRITDHWSLRSFLRYQRDNSPAAGRDEDDLSLMLGVGYSLAGFPEPKKSGRRTLKPDREIPSATPMGWTRTAALGYAMTSGNADHRSLTASIDAAYRAETHEFFFNSAYSYGEDKGVTSLHQLQANARLNRLFGPRRFIGGGIGLLHDELADLSYRLTPSATAGYYLVKNDRLSLSLEAGPGYTFEKTGGLRSDYLSLVAAERFSWVLAPRFTLKQSVVWEAEAADVRNHTVAATASLDTDITPRVAFRVGLTYLYDNTPAAARAHHDTTLSSGIAVKF